MKAYAGDPVKGLSPFPVSLTREGYPRIIPAFHRRMIYRKDEKADLLVQLYLSWFSLAKVIQLAKPITALIVLYNCLRTWILSLRSSRN